MKGETVEHCQNTPPKYIYSCPEISKNVPDSEEDDQTNNPRIIRYALAVPSARLVHYARMLPQDALTIHKARNSKIRKHFKAALNVPRSRAQLRPLSFRPRLSRGAWARGERERERERARGMRRGWSESQATFCKGTVCLLLNSC